MTVVTARLPVPRGQLSEEEAGVGKGQLVGQASILQFVVVV